MADCEIPDVASRSDMQQHEPSPVSSAAITESAAGGTVHCAGAPRVVHGEDGPTEQLTPMSLVFV